MYSFGLPLYAKLSDVISNSELCWPAIRSIDMAEIIQLVSLLTSGTAKDMAQWLPSTNLSFFINSTWNASGPIFLKCAWLLGSGLRELFPCTVLSLDWSILTGSLQKREWQSTLAV